MAETGQKVRFTEGRSYERGMVNFMPDDAAYLDAANRGDMETAQRMVDEAAKAAGTRLGRSCMGLPVSLVNLANERVGE